MQNINNKISGLGKIISNFFLKHTILYVIILIAIAVITHLNWFNPYSILNYSDWYFWPNGPTGELYLSWNTWISILNTGSQNIQIPFLGFKAIWSLVIYMGGSYDLATKITFFWPIALGGFLTPFFFGKAYFRSAGIGFILAIFYGSTTYFLLRQSVHLPIAIIYAFTPLIFQILYRIVQDNKIRDWIYFTLLYSCFIVYEVRITLIVSSILFLFFLTHVQRGILRYLKNGIATALGIILINLYWLIPTILGGGMNEVSKVANRGLFGNHLFTLPQAFSIFESAWTGGFPNADFVSQPILWYTFIYTIFVFVAIIVVSQRDKRFFFWIIISFVGVFLTKQSQGPLPEMYEWMYLHVPGFSLFREASKFYLVTAMGYLGLLGYSLFYFSKKNGGLYKVISIILIIPGLINLYPLINQSIGGTFTNRSYPIDYKVIEDAILKDHNYYRTLSVPLRSQWSYYDVQHPGINMTDQVAGAWKGYINASKKIAAEQILSPFSMPAFKEMLDLNSIKYIIIPLQDTNNDNDFFRFYGLPRGEYITYLDKYLQKVDLGTRDVVIYENQNYYPHILLNGSQFSFLQLNPTEYQLYSHIGYSGSILSFLESYHPQWKLYLEPYAPLDCGTGAMVYSGTTMDSGTGAKPLLTSPYQGRDGTTDATSTGIYLSQRGDTLASIARSQTGMTLTGIIALNPGITREVLRRGTEIVVSTSEQNPPNPISQGGSGATEQTGTGESYHVTECPSANTFYAGGELAKLWQEPIFDDTHQMVYDYANQWTIDPAYIRANYPREYYRENSDGTIDVRMTMYFRPQSYFYLGLIISGLTLFGCVSYLVVSGVRGRRRLREHGDKLVDL